MESLFCFHGLVLQHLVQKQLVWLQRDTWTLKFAVSHSMFMFYLVKTAQSRPALIYRFLVHFEGQVKCLLS